MKVVLVMFKDGERRDFPIADGKTVVGRRQDCGLRIPTADVSRQHCEVGLAGNELVVRDLGSSNGTYVNGKRVAEAKLFAGDKLSVGPIVFIVQVNGLPPKLTPFDAKVELPPAAGANKAAPGKPTEKRNSKDDDDDDTEEVLDLEDVDLSDMFDDDDDDDDPKPRPKKK